ncbi:AsmA-like C-terminal region-containing protein, partial [Vibrio sp. 1078-1]
KTPTLQGNVSTEFGKGVVSEVSGAARLLGLFSLDSIIRKMQLDFTDVFDKGMAFNSITGTGKIQDGVFITNDIVMDALAGEMQIRGIANMTSRMVDAEVKFTPDITSGLPMLTAFAVAPQTALYVLAISTVISPVVEVFTQVNYEVKGPLDSPTVKEISRSKGEYKLPEKLREQAK